MIIGCVKEIKNNEFRVGMTPENVLNYVRAGHQVLIEAGAGEGSGFSDEEYKNVGAAMEASAADVWNKSEMIIKVKEPLADEYKYFRKGLLIYTYFHLSADKALFEALMESGATAIAYETLIERDGSVPLLKPMSEIAGRLSVQEGAKYLEKPFGGCGVLLAGVPGTQKGNVVIVGAGNVGQNACRIAVGMGANVTIMDLDYRKLTKLDEEYGARIQTLISSDSAVHNAVKNADLVVGCVLIPGKRAPQVIKREYLKDMRPGSVIVDVAVDQGGCCETTKVTYHDDPTYVVDGVVHYCVGNMPGAVPRTSTIALTSYTLKYGLDIAKAGLPEACKKNSVIYSAVNTYEGKCTCKNVADDFSVEYVSAEVALA